MVYALIGLVVGGVINYLADTLPRLPSQDETNLPVTLDLNGFTLGTAEALTLNGTTKWASAKELQRLGEQAARAGADRHVVGEHVRAVPQRRQHHLAAR